MLKSLGLFKIEGYYRQILHKYAGLGYFHLYLICNSPWKFGNFPHSSRSMDALNKSVPYIFIKCPIEILYLGQVKPS